MTSSPSCDHLRHAGPDWTRCPRCNTTCVRDHSGAIVIYERGTRDAPRAAASAPYMEPSP